ncbi:MAG: hypothetical protein K2X28_05555 [Alphaproteobacteria bacterium]|nr:hypothetical protein [Alphaproteobacteria bacterium]
MTHMRNIDTFLYFYNEAHRITPPQWNEKQEIFLGYAALNTDEHHIKNNKPVFETTFAPYSGMKVYI